MSTSLTSPYPGGPPVVNALLGAHVTTVLANYSDVVEHLNAGKLRALAIASHARIASLPEVPTVAESGYEGYDLDVWVGVLAPAKTPKDATSQLAHWFTAAMKAPEIESKLVMLGYYPVGLCGADFRAHIKKQSEEYGRVIRELKHQGGVIRANSRPHVSVGSFPDVGALSREVRFMLKNGHRQRVDSLRVGNLCRCRIRRWDVMERPLFEPRTDIVGATEHVR